MLHVHFSNRYEALSRLLRRRLSGTRTNVFAGDQVIVPSTGIRRALTLEIADGEGVCANVEFVYLARWLWQQVARVVPGVAEESPFDPGPLAWRVYAAFGDDEFVDAHPRLAAYLRHAGADDLMRYELAVKVAGLLEQYVTYRTDWLAKWQGGAAPHPRPLPKGAREQESSLALPPSEGASSLPPPSGEGGGGGGPSTSSGRTDFSLPPPPGEGGGGGQPSTGSGRTQIEDQAWQAALWQRIAGELELAADHPVALLVRALERGGAKLARDAGLPSTVHVFALAAMPPLHLQALQALGRWIDVHLYVLNPCREFWFDLVDPKQLSNLEAAGQGLGFEVGHRLLASWGKQTQSSLALLAGVVDAEGAPSTDEYEANPSSTLLAQLQNSILDLAELEPASVQLAPGDRSIEVHVCHSLTRELEVLHDHLLGLFAADPALKPSDILVVTPDLPGAAPLIEAVFGTAPADRRIPFAVTGRPRSSINAPVKAFLELLALAASRCAASDVFGLLQQPVVARRFGLDEPDLQQVHDWMLAAGIHWGLDSEHVAAFDLPRQGSHTLADGLERLYLGYALPDTVLEPFDGLLPSGAAEGSSAVALGAFWRFVDALQTLRAAIAAPRRPADWAAQLHSAADIFLAPANAEIEDHLELHAVLDELAATMQRGGLGEPVSGAVVRAALQAAFEDPARGGVPTGRVTFASMSSLRNVPFEVVCAIGLNDGAFPTADRPPEFDLMAQAPRLGDRQRRTDQRTLFLDLVLAARQSLYLSYVGRSIRDNAPLPPSVLVAELLDVLVPATAQSDDSEKDLKAARDRLVVTHPLQPFSPQAFDVHGDERVRSFDAELAQALRASLQAPPATAPDVDSGLAEFRAEEEEGDGDGDEATPDLERPFFAQPLPEPGADWRSLTVNQLVEFFNNPSRYLLRRRLQVDLAWEDEPLADDEPFLPDVPARSRLAARLLPVLLEGADADTVRRLAHAGTELPAGALGDAETGRELAKLQRFAGAVRQAMSAQPLPPHQSTIALHIEGEPWTIDAAFADLRSAGLVRWRYDDERARDILTAWAHHLVLCAAPPPGARPVTRWLARNGERHFARLDPEQARDHLAQLLGLYRSGLRAPLHFFPKSAWGFVQKGWGKARSDWQGSPDFGGEGDKPGYRLAFRGQPDPLDNDFEQLAETVFGPVAAISTARPFSEDQP